MAIRRAAILAILALATMALACSATSAAVVYVDGAAGNDGNDGLSWATAKKTVTKGLSAASSGGEVWVAATVYVERIELKSGVKLYGGFPAGGGVWETRNWTANPTILDGNQGGSVVTSFSGTAASTRIDGFTIRNGRASYGGGIDCDGGSPTIANNIISGNTATDSGGGGIKCSSSSPTISSNTITGNTSSGSVNGGGGIFCYSSSPLIAGNTISGNTASTGGGGIFCFYSSSPAISDNAITSNTANYDGGGISCSYSSSPTISNNTITSNTASECGGGIRCSSSSSPTIANNTIAGNTTSSNYTGDGGGGIYCDVSSPAILNNTITGNTAPYHGGGIYCYDSSPALSNNIVAFNSSGIYKGAGTPTLQYNCVYGNASYQYSSGLLAGTGDISLDPLFVDRPGGDYHLMSGSPCIDAGNNGAVQPDWLDMDGQPRVLGGDVDMGADEFEGVPAIPTPGFSPDGGAYTSAKSVAINCFWPGVTIRYTTNGVDPTEADAIVSGPVPVDIPMTLKAVAWKEGSIPSRVRSASYSLRPVTPTFSLVGGSYASPQSVTVACTTEGAVIHYTTNGVDPTEADSTIVSGSSLPVNTNQEIRAKAWKTGWDPSETMSATYTLVTATPTFAPGGGTYGQAQDVTISCADSTAVIYYTTNGKTPTDTDPVVAAGSTVRVSRSLPLMARAQRSGWSMSTTRYAEYVISGSSSVIHVKPDGSDDSDGVTWDSAMKTVQAGINACVSSMEVWVAAGTYTERISLKNGVALYGGFSGTETSRGERDWLTNQTVLDGNKSGSVVTVPHGAAASTRIDGFTIRNGKASFGGGIYCDYSSSPTISNNTIIGNTATYGGGINCSSGSPTISNNTITGNSASSGAGGGVYHYGSSGSATISNNVVSDNSATSSSSGSGGYGGGVFSNGSAVISNNTIIGNSASGSGGGGVHCTADAYQASTISNNTITGNSAIGPGGGVYSNGSVTVSSNAISGNTASTSGGGVYCSSSSPLSNNTIAGNAAPSAGGICCVSSSPALSNNIVASNSSGIYRSGGTPTLRSNCVYGNTSYNYSGLTAGTGDIAADPLFANAAGGDYHLTPASPCINAGWNGASSLGLVDMDGEPRVQNSVVDIGVDELPVTMDVTTIIGARTAGEGAFLEFSNGIVSAAFPDFFYVEDQSRCGGIRVDMPGHKLIAGQTAHVVGRVRTNSDFERHILAGIAEADGTGSVTPLYMNNRTLGGGPFGTAPNYQRGVSEQGVGLNNIGLLVRTSGEFSYLDASGFTIDDGSGLDVRCWTAPGVTLDPDWDSVAVTGVSSCRADGPNIARLLRVSKQSDISLTKGAMITGNVRAGGIQAVTTSVDSPHPYPNNYNNTRTIAGPSGTTRMRVHFTSIQTQSLFDNLYVKDGSGVTQQTYSGSYSDTWTNWVTGNAIKLNLKTNGSVTGFGFYVDKYEADSPALLVEGATVTLTPGSLTYTTGADGRYFFRNLEGGDYTLTPSLAGATFTPSSLSSTVTFGQYAPHADFRKN